MAFLELVTLTKRWPRMAVSVDLSVDEGRALAIAGPSGCGKSTALRMAAGLERPDSGRVLVGGIDVSDAEPSDRGIGMVFQDYALFPHLDVGENIAYGLRVRGVRRRDRIATVKRLLDAIGLSGFEARRPHELSGGERQRVALARTLAVEPRIVLFDEPLSSLDAALRKRLRADIVDEQRRLGFTAVYVTHDLEEAMAIGDTLAVMEAGRVLQCAPPAQLWERPASVAVARFMGSGPALEVVGVERSDGEAFAVTGAGRFALGSEGLAAYDGMLAAGNKAFVHFERSAARRAPSAAASIEARCLRADFAGDSVDCAMESGDERFTLRFSRRDAPALGESGRYVAEVYRLIPDIRIR